MTPNKVTSTVIDIFSSEKNAEQLAHLLQKLHGMSVIDTGGLFYERTLVIRKTYMITATSTLVTLMLQMDAQMELLVIFLT